MMIPHNDEQLKRTPNISSSFLGIGLAVLLACSAFFSGVQIGSGALARGDMEAGLFSFWKTKAVQPKEADLSEFWEVWEKLEEKYVSASSTDTVTVDERIEGAIKGLVRSYGDPYTVYLPPSDAGYFEEEISGNFGGVGMEVGIREDVVTVIAPLPDTPAAKAGILPRDVLVKIDDRETSDMSIDEAVRLIRGQEGTTVTLTIFREGTVELLTIPVVRAKIDIPTIKTEVRGDVFVISLYSFNAVAHEKVKESLSEFAKSGKKKLILDVRGNPGGYLQSAVAIASYFLPSGKVVVSEGATTEGKGEVFRSSGKNLGAFMPQEMLVLVDGGSASASEIVAGALQEHGVAKLLGVQTYGKGSVQELIDLDGSEGSLKVTIAQWYTPNGRSISEGGLKPDIEVARSAQQMLDKVDPQLEAALKWLAGDKSVGSSTPKQTN
jgi:carboxyl-terminal processing protease